MKKMLSKLSGKGEEKEGVQKAADIARPDSVQSKAVQVSSERVSGWGGCKHCSLSDKETSRVTVSEAFLRRTRPYEVQLLILTSLNR